MALVRSYLYTSVHTPSMKLQQKAKKHCSEKISFFSLPLNCTETFTSGKPDQRKGNVSLHIKTVFAFSGWNKDFPGDLTTRFLLSSLLLMTFTCFVSEFLSKLLFSGLQKKSIFPNVMLLESSDSVLCQFRCRTNLDKALAILQEKADILIL